MAQTQQAVHWKREFEPGLERGQREGRHVLLDFSAAPM